MLCLIHDLKVSVSGGLWNCGDDEWQKRILWEYDEYTSRLNDISVNNSTLIK